MSYVNRFSAFQEKSKPQTPVQAGPVAGPGYKAWKNKEVTADGKAIKKEVNISSVSEFPDLVQVQSPKTSSAFAGTSLAAKLKEVIAAEEEAAILKRIKKGETPEDIFRESCTILPLKTKMLSADAEFKAPWWVTDTSNPIVMPRFNPRSYEEQRMERFYRRYGINPVKTMLFDDQSSEYEYEEDSISVASLPEESLCEPTETEVA
jgi:hypothetical protein